MFHRDHWVSNQHALSQTKTWQHSYSFAALSSMTIADALLRGVSLFSRDSIRDELTVIQENY